MLFRRFAVMLLVLILLVGVPVASADEGDPIDDPAADLADLFTDPRNLAAVVALLSPQLFDLFEAALVALGWGGLIDNANKKRVVAWGLSAVLSVGALFVAAQLFPDYVTFTLDAAYALAAAVVAIALGQASFAVQKARGMMIASRT
jgi:hypothetical protein